MGHNDSLQIGVAFIQYKNTFKEFTIHQNVFFSPAKL